MTALADLLGWYDSHRDGDLSEPWERILFAALDHCGHAATEDAYEQAAADHAERGGDIAHVIRRAVADGINVAGVHEMIGALVRDIATSEAAILEATVARPFLIAPGTQAAAVAAIAPEALALGVAGPGGVYKPDASPTTKPCARCSAPAMWIAGAGQALCVKHQDDY